MEVPSRHVVRNLDTLCESETLPRLFAGDTIILNEGNLESLSQFANLLVEDLLNDHQRLALNRLVRRLKEEFLEFDDLPLAEQDELFVAEVPQLLFPNADMNRFKDRVVRNFETGINLTEAKLMGSNHVQIGSSANKLYYGWITEVTAVLNLPDVMPGTTINFPFVVAHNGHSFRAGPYNEQKHSISQLETPELKRALAARNKPGAFANSGSQRHKPKRGGSTIHKGETNLSGKSDGFF